MYVFGECNGGHYVSEIYVFEEHNGGDSYVMNITVPPSLPKTFPSDHVKLGQPGNKSTFFKSPTLMGNRAHDTGNSLDIYRSTVVLG